MITADIAIGAAFAVSLVMLVFGLMVYFRIKRETPALLFALSGTLGSIGCLLLLLIRMELVKFTLAVPLVILVWAAILLMISIITGWRRRNP